MLRVLGDPCGCLRAEFRRGVSQRPYGAHVFFYSRYPGFHPGLFSRSPSGGKYGRGTLIFICIYGPMAQLRHAEQVAERCIVLDGVPEDHPSGAKARRFFCGICGTTEVVPCYKTLFYQRWPRQSLAEFCLVPEFCYLNLTEPARRDMPLISAAEASA